MAEVINLNATRKRRARAAADQQAAGNRAKFGRTRAQKARDQAEGREAKEKLDRLRLDPQRD